MPNHNGRGLLGQITAMADRVGKVLPAMQEAVLTTLAATGELLTDGNLRRKAGELIVNEKNNLQKGLEDRTEQVTREAKARFGAGAQKIQALLRNLERQVERQKRARQEADAAGGLLVDIQIGDQVFEDMPPELRSRLWYVLLEAPHLAEPLRPISGPGCSHTTTSSSPLARSKSARRTAPGAASSSNVAASSSSSPAGTTSDPAPVEAGAGPAGGEVAQVAAGGCCSVAPLVPGCPPAAPNPWGPQLTSSSGRSTGGPHSGPTAGGNTGSQGDNSTGCAPATTSSSSSAAAPQLQPQPGSPAHAVGPHAATTSSSAAIPTGGTSSSHGAGSSGASSNNDGSSINAGGVGSHGAGEWELVGRSPSGRVSSSGQLDALGRAREVLRRSQGEEDSGDSSSGMVPTSTSYSSHGGAGSSDGVRAAKARLLAAMQEVPWLPGEGIPNDIDPLGDYQRALALECPAADDIISRDINRTFPDHPQFRDPAGQAALWRVLHAYATTDAEVGYCQGMGFCAGLLLMYVPEEVAWRLFCRLMGPPPGGCNLRRLYLPGLNPLKAELSRFELLLSSHQPALHGHLLAAGLPAVLYVSQWVMTTYCCPFPVHFAARLVDVMLQEGHDGVLARVGLVMMEALAADLLALDDFEALITHVKVAPLSWPLHTYRQVLEAALDSPVSQEELDAAAGAVAAELARLGRPSSFREAALRRTISSGGTVGHRLVSTGREGAAAEGGEVAGEGGAAAAAAAGDGGTALLEEGMGVLPPAAGVAPEVGPSGATGAGGVEEQPGAVEVGGMHVSMSAAAAAQLDAELLDAGLGLGLLLTGMDLSEEGESPGATTQQQHGRHPHQD